MILMISLFQNLENAIRNSASPQTDDILNKCYNVPRHITVHSDEQYLW